MLKYLLDLFPLIVFFMVYKKFDIFYASGALIITSIVSTIILYYIYKKIDKLTILTLLIVCIFSGLTLFYHNDHFIKWKVTIVYSIFSLSLIISQFFTKKSLIQRIFDKNIQLSYKNWNTLNLIWAIFFGSCALINIYVAFWYSQNIWVNFKVFGLTVITILNTIFSIIYIYKKSK